MTLGPNNKCLKKKTVFDVSDCLPKNRKKICSFNGNARFDSRLEKKKNILVNPMTWNNHWSFNFCTLDKRKTVDSVNGFDPFWHVFFFNIIYNGFFSNDIKPSRFDETDFVMKQITPCRVMVYTSINLFKLQTKIYNVKILVKMSAKF